MITEKRRDDHLPRITVMRHVMTVAVFIYIILVLKAAAGLVISA